MDTPNLSETIYTQLGIENLPDEYKMDFLSKVTELVLKRTMNRVADRMEQMNLSQDQQDAIFSAQTEQEQFEKIQHYVPELSQLLEEEIERVRTDLVSQLGSK